MNASLTEAAQSPFPPTPTIDEDMVKLGRKLERLRQVLYAIGVGPVNEADTNDVVDLVCSIDTGTPRPSAHSINLFYSNSKISACDQDWFIEFRNASGTYRVSGRDKRQYRDGSRSYGGSDPKDMTIEQIEQEILYTLEAALPENARSRLALIGLNHLIAEGPADAPAPTRTVATAPAAN
jgi:hypothetical protein